MKKKIRLRNEFRYHKMLIKNKNGKLVEKPHPSYIWLQNGQQYHYHSITHSCKVDGIKLKKFTKNPNPNDKRNSYYGADSKADLIKNFGPRKKKWEISDTDYAEIRKNHKNKK